MVLRSLFVPNSSGKGQLLVARSPDVHEDSFVNQSSSSWSYIKYTYIADWAPYGTLRTGDVEDSDVEDTTLRTCDFEDRRL